MVNQPLNTIVLDKLRKSQVRLLDRSVNRIRIALSSFPEWQFVTNELVKHAPQRPHIDLKRIPIPLEHLRSHVMRRTDDRESFEEVLSI